MKPKSVSLKRSIKLKIILIRKKKEKKRKNKSPLSGIKAGLSLQIPQI